MERTTTFAVFLVIGLLAAEAALANEDARAETTADHADEAVPGDMPPAATRVDGRDLPREAMALELAGVRNLGVLIITSEPVGAEVTLPDGSGCVTPCRQVLPPGRYRLVFEHEGGAPMEVEADVTTQESVRVHVTLGRRTPHEIIVPLYFVGSIFTAGGISSMVLNRDAGPRPIDESEGDADSRRFHRNLGAASVAVGVPLLVLATYLLAAGRPGKVSVSAGPARPGIGLAPMSGEFGELVGARVTGSF